MRSTRMSSGVRAAAAVGLSCFQRSRPASAAALSGDWEMVMRGCLEARGFRVVLGICADSEEDPTLSDDETVGEDGAHDSCSRSDPASVSGWPVVALERF